MRNFEKFNMNTKFWGKEFKIQCIEQILQNRHTFVNLNKYYFSKKVRKLHEKFRIL